MTKNSIRKPAAGKAIATEEGSVRDASRRERDAGSLNERLERLAEETVAMGRPGGRVMTKDEIDELWGSVTGRKHPPVASTIR